MSTENENCKNGVCFLSTPTMEPDSKTEDKNENDSKGRDQLLASFQQMQSMLTNSLKEACCKKNEKKQKRNSEASRERSENSSEPKYPDFRWTAVHQLLDSHNTLCNLLAELLDRDDSDTDSDEDSDTDSDEESESKTDSE